MTILTRTGTDPARIPAETAADGNRPVTRPGAGGRVDTASPAATGNPGHSIDAMDQLSLPVEIATALTAPPEDTRAWAYERALAAAAQGLLWWDNHGNLWRWDGTPAVASYVFGDDERATRELRTGQFLRMVAPKVDMPATDQRTLRVRRVTLTETGTALYRRWAALATYTG